MLVTLAELQRNIKLVTRNPRSSGVAFDIPGGTIEIARTQLVISSVLPLTAPITIGTADFCLLTFARQHGLCRLDRFAYEHFLLVDPTNVTTGLKLVKDRQLVEWYDAVMTLAAKQSKTATETAVQEAVATAIRKQQTQGWIENAHKKRNGHQTELASVAGTSANA